MVLCIHYWYVCMHGDLDILIDIMIYKYYKLTLQFYTNAELCEPILV